MMALQSTDDMYFVNITITSYFEDKNLKPL
jgi:hypothetical protein